MNNGAAVGYPRPGVLATRRPSLQLPAALTPLHAVRILKPRGPRNG